MQTAWIRMKCRVTLRLIQIRAVWHLDNILTNFGWPWSTLKIEADGKFSWRQFIGRLSVKGNVEENVHCIPGQQIRSKIDSFQNANFLISQPNPMMLPLIESSRRYDFNEGHIIGFGWEMRKLSWNLFCSLFLNCSPAPYILFVNVMTNFRNGKQFFFILFATFWRGLCMVETVVGCQVTKLDTYYRQSTIHLDNII